MEYDSISSNDTDIMYMEYNITSLDALGPEMQAFLISLYSLTAIMAFAGNITVVIVLLTGKRSSRELRIFLINLALSDITMAIFSIPFTYTDFMFGRWIFDPNFCPFVQFMQHCSVIVSVYTLAVIGVDRYYAIMYPLNFRWTKSRGSLVVFCIWLLAIALSSVQLIHGKAKKFVLGGEEYYDCVEEWNEISGKIYTVVVFAVTFVLPMTILIYTYSTVGWKMWRHTLPGNADPTRDHQQLQAKIKVVKMLAVVVLLFAACWLPIHVLNLLIYFFKDELSPNTDNEYYGYIAAFFSCHWLSMANSFVNPIIYCFMSDNFRADLKQLVYCCCADIRKEKGARGLTPAFNSSCSSSFHTTSMIITGNNAKYIKNNDIPLTRSTNNQSLIIQYSSDHSSKRERGMCSR
ncbi:RYamide receptor-like isoform X1 [Centruroides vittatus]|uniref:RYamide receptor-like isoform X1 n=3 Tax=Centruroides TaxID=6875 RepID=UPI00350E915A